MIDLNQFAGLLQQNPVVDSVSGSSQIIAPEIAAEPQLQDTVVRKGAFFEQDPNKVIQNAEILSGKQKEATKIAEKANVVNTAADRELNQKSADLTEELGAIEKDFAVKQAELHQQQNEEHKARMVEIENAVKKAAAHGAKGVFEADKATKVKGVIAAAVGGFLEPILKTNTIQKILNRAADEQLQAYREKGKSLQDNLKNLEGVDSMFQAAELNQDKQDKLDKLVMMSAITKEYEAQLQRMKDPKIIAKGLNQLAAIKSDLAKKFEDIRRFETDRTLKDLSRKQSALEQAKNRGAAAARQKREFKFRLQKEERDALRAHKLAQAKANGDLQERVVLSPKTGKPLGVTNTAFTTKQREQLVEKTSEAYEAAERLKEFIFLAKKHGKVFNGHFGDFLRTKDGQELRSAYARYRNARLRAVSGQAVTENELKRLQEEVPLSTVLGASVESNMAAWKGQLNDIARSIEMRHNSAGLRESNAFEEITAIAEPVFNNANAVSPKQLLTHIADGPQGLNPTNETRIDAVNSLSVALDSNASVQALPFIENSLEQAKTAIDATGTPSEKRAFAKALSRAKRSLREAKAKESPKKKKAVIKREVSKSGGINTPNKRKR